MLKHMKYELKGTYKFMLGILLTVLVATSGLQIYGRGVFNNYFGKLNSQFEPSAAGGLFLTLMGFVIFGAFVAALFYIIGSFRKELYEDRGYLTFTLPLTGYQILGSKTLIALMWSGVLIVFSLLYNLLLAMVLHGGSIFGGLKEAVYIFSLGANDVVLTFFLALIFSAISTLLLIYFSIALSRVTIGNKKIGGAWIVIYLVLNALFTYVTLKVVDILPYYLDLNNFKIIAGSEIGNYLGNSVGYFMSPGNDTGMIVSG